jgi:hypothetical protein
LLTSTQVFQEIYSRGPGFTAFKTALTQAKFPPTRDHTQLQQLWPDDQPRLKKFTDKILRCLKESKELSKVKISGVKDLAEKLISESSYNVTSKVGRANVAKLCRIALDETDPPIRAARERFVGTSEGTELRRNLWLKINQVLAFEPNTIDGVPRKFSFWDGIPDCREATVLGGGVYSHEVAVEVGKCFSEDAQDFKALGDFLATSRALVNNRNDAKSLRVIEKRTKELIDQLLDVSIGATASR